jgi:hypothetical protein
MALAPAKAQWIATGGSIEDWNKLAIPAVTTASYSIRSPGLLDLLKDPALLNGPRRRGHPVYGDGVDGETPDLPDPLAPSPKATPRGEAPPVSTGPGRRLTPPAMGRITNTFAQHTARGSAWGGHRGPHRHQAHHPHRRHRSGRARRASSGLFVKIVSPDGKVSRSLAHLSLAQVQNGQHVTPGRSSGARASQETPPGPTSTGSSRLMARTLTPSATTSRRKAQTRRTKQPFKAARARPRTGRQRDHPPATHPDGPSLYDMAGVADQVESDRYRIRSSVNSEATDRLQAIAADRKLKGLEATDRLYATFGSKLLTGDVSADTIVSTLGKEYAPQVIAEAMSNIRAAVADTEGLGRARLGLNDTDPQKSKELFDLATEGRTSGWSQDYEDRVGQKVISGEISASDGISMVGAAIERAHSQQAEARAQANFDRANPPSTPGQTIKRAGDTKAGIDKYAQLLSSSLRRVGKVMTAPQFNYAKRLLTEAVLTHLVNHPGDYAGAEQVARDFIASIVGKNLPGAAATATPKPSAPASSGGSNPRR